MIATKRGTFGVRAMPDRLDSGYCHLRCPDEAVVRINLDGVYTSLCQAHRDALMYALHYPEPAPPARHDD